MNLREYARAVAEAVNREWEGRDPSDETRDWLDGIVASVPAPTNSVSTGSKLVGTPDIDPEEVRRALDAFEREWGSPGGVAAQDGLTLMAAAREYLRLREQPAPDEELPRRGGGTIGVGTLAYFQANNENQLQQAMLRRVIALEKALGRERARALLCERLGVEAESLGDLLCARSDLGAISDVMLAAGAMFDVGVEVLPDLSQQLPIHGPVRLPSMPIVPQPAPDVQAVKLCNCGKCCPGPLYSQHERDAAVARERDRVIGIFVGELQKLHENTVLDCGDNSCLFATRRGGMRTNGGCRCIERLLDAAVAREREAAVYDFAAWLTTRKERLVLSSSDDAAPAAKAVQAYLRARSAKGSE